MMLVWYMIPIPLLSYFKFQTILYVYPIQGANRMKERVGKEAAFRYFVLM